MWISRGLAKIEPLTRYTDEILEMRFGDNNWIASPALLLNFFSL